MPVLTLKFKDKPIADYQLTKGQSLTIGRRSNNNIVIENLAVSGHHAKIDSVGDGFVLTDLQSKNGVFVNDQLVTSHWLNHGDSVSIGKHTLVFSYQQGEERPIEAKGAMDQTMVMDTSKQRNLLSAHNTPPAKPTPKDAQAAESRGVLAFLHGGEGEVELTKKLTKIGKDTTADIRVGGFGVGHTAATISKRPNGYYLSYVGGMSKVKVNSNPIKESVSLKEFDIIELGSVKMQFFTK